jgi:hypothetical protein
MTDSTLSELERVGAEPRVGGANPGLNDFQPFRLNSWGGQQFEKRGEGSKAAQTIAFPSATWERGKKHSPTFAEIPFRLKKKHRG